MTARETDGIPQQRDDKLDAIMYGAMKHDPKHQPMRDFATGATRSNDAGKPDYEGFLCPLVLERFGRYMSEHRIQADGNIRDSDNWQKGIPKTAYIKSMWRHVMDWWKYHRGNPIEYGIEETLCAVMFNTMGYLHEHLKAGLALKRIDALVAAHPKGWATGKDNPVFPTGHPREGHPYDRPDWLLAPNQNDKRP